MDEGRKRIIRERVLVEMIPHMRDEVTMVDFNTSIDKITDAVERQFDGARSALLGGFVPEDGLRRDIKVLKEFTKGKDDNLHFAIEHILKFIEDGGHKQVFVKTPELPVVA